MKKILVVDDCPVVLKMMDEMLTGLNYEVTTSHDGQDAVEKVEAASYNMIIVDMNMPRLNGIEFTKRAKQMPNCKFVPIVMLSSENDEEKISAAKQVGISTFLRKPVKESQLSTILNLELGALHSCSWGHLPGTGICDRDG